MNVYLLVTLESCPVLAVVDTACQITVMSYEMLDKCSIDPDGYSGTIKLKGAAKQGCMMGYIFSNLRLQIGQMLVHLDVCLAPISDLFMIGLDFLRSNDAVIDLPRSLLTIRNEQFPIEIRREKESDRDLCVQLVRNLVVAPRTGMHVQCKINEPIANATVLIFQIPTENDIEIPSITSDVQDGLVIVPVLNLSKRHVTLKAGCTIACAEIAAASSIKQISTETDKDSSAAEFLHLGSTMPNHLRTLFENSIKNLSTEEAIALSSLLVEFQDVFAKTDTDLGCLKGVEHEIDTGNANPIKQRMRRTPIGFESEEDKHLQSMLDNGIIRPSFSQWSSPPVLVRKKDGSIRWCIDYRQLNNVTKKDVFPLPLIEECLDTLAGTEYFSTLDMASGYWQIPIREQDKCKSAFITKRGLFEHNRMAFGLCNAPATFQRAMQLVFDGLMWDTVLAYIDDVIVLGSNFENHLLHLRTVFQRLRSFNLKLKARKCSLLQTKVTFLGKVVSKHGITMDPKKVEKVLNWPVPLNVKELQSFLGFVNYHRDHIRNYASLSAPLYALVGAKQEFLWSREASNAFDALKQALTSAPILGFPCPNGEFILDTDASDLAIGAELSQIQEGETRVIAFSSYVLTPAQRNYCTTRKELLAVVCFTRVFRHYLLGRPFKVRTDHSSLAWLLRFKNIGGQLARWLEELSQYSMTILHRPGVKHGNADSLSRIPDRAAQCNCYYAGCTVETLPCGGCSFCTRAHEQWSRFEEDVDDVVPLSVKEVPIRVHEKSAKVDVRAIQGGTWFECRSMEDWQTLQERDADISPVVEWLHSNSGPSGAELAKSSQVTKRLWQNRPLLHLQNGVLFYNWHQAGRLDTVNINMCVVVPRGLINEVMRECHDLPLTGHGGRDKTLEKVRSQYYWPGMSHDVELYVASCSQCSRNKRAVRHARAGQQSYHAGAVMERVHIDFMGPFPITTSGNKYVLMVVDQFTKWLECYPLPNQTAETVAKTMVNQFFARFGIPLIIHSDQGTNFESKLFQAVCELLKITRTRTTPYHPASNGQIERMNRTVLQMIRCFLQKDSTEWDEYLPQLAGAIRATVNRSTGFTPNRMMLGREVQLPVFSNSSASGAEAPPEYVLQLQKMQQIAHAEARMTLQSTQTSQKRYYDLHKNEKLYQMGDVVLLRQDASKAGSCKKLNPVWVGPYLIVAILSPVIMKLRGPRKTFVVHHDRVKLCRDRQLPLWLRRARHELLHPTVPFRDPVAKSNQRTAVVEPDVLSDIHLLFAESQPKESNAIQPKSTRVGRVPRLPLRLRHLSL